MLKVYHSNRLEHLLERFVEVTAAPLAGPLTPETVVTQSQGMARWLALRLAERRGIAANIEFVLPAAFIWRLFGTHLPEAGQPSGFDREVLTWRLMQLLPARLDEPGFEPLARYLRGERAELKRYQLCRRIADVFDQYLVYRPDLIHAWEAGAEEHWQARLWRALGGNEHPHRAGLLGRFLDDALTLAPARLPERVCIFGIPSLPPAYLDVVAKLAATIDVHLFALNPCLLYWGDIVAPRNIARIRQQRARLGQPLDDDYLTSGNSLLASLGRQGRDFIDALHDHAAEEEELFALPASPGILGLVQADMLTLEERGRSAPKLPLPADDDSLQVHLCHSPLREVEVLHDQLLARFDADPTLRPQDVLVMTPDIEQYAPYIEAVFGAAPEGRRIPFAIADLSRQSEHPVVQAFLQLLALPGSRFTANDVLSLLELPAVLRRFGLDFDDFETLRHWVRDAGIRWGLDGRARADLTLPDLDANTWAFGFRRLFLGYAMAPTGERLFEGVLPYPHIEGQAVALLGRLRTFVDRLADLAARLARPHTAAEWAALINDLLEAFFQPDGDDAEPLQIVREAAANLVGETGSANYGEPFGIDVLRDHLRGELGGTRTEQRLLTGRLTFCAMIPMRSLPFRIIALIGMNDGAFPRQQRPPGFDLMAESPRKGDRSRREEDRYLFLEALISARERFYVSYVGRNIRDNSPQLPSVLVSELLDYVDQAFAVEAGAPREHLTIEHPLQPFSERYYGAEPGLYSYAAEWLPALQAKASDPQPEPPFCPAPLAPQPHAGAAETAAPAEPIDLAALRRFFRHPARAFLRGRLGVYLDGGEEVLDDNEPFALDGLQRHQLHDGLLEHLLADGAVEPYRAVLKARGTLPNSRFADLLLDGEVADVEALADTVRPLIRDPLPHREVELHGPDWRLTGWLDRLTRQGLVRYRVGRAKAVDLIELWVEHLVLNALAPADCPRVSQLVAGDGTRVLAEVAGARSHLDRLIASFRQGQHAPLKLMPRAAYAYAEALHADKPPLPAAQKAWESNAYNRGEDADADHRLAFRGTDPLDEEFEQLAAAVYGPLIDALRRGEAR